MANNVPFQSAAPATPSSATIVETVDQGGGVQRQVVRVGDFATGVAVSSGTITLSSNPTVIPSSNVNVVIVGVPSVSLSSNPTVTPSSAFTVTLSSNPTVIEPVKNILWNAGTANNGLLTTSLTLISSEMTSLASSGTVTGAATIFNNSQTGQAIWSEIYLTGNTTATTVAGANVAGWFLTAPTSNTTIETTAAGAIPRPPDFLIPLPVGTLGSSTTYKAAGLVRVPALQFKVNIQNNANIVWGSSTSGLTVIQLVPISEAY